MKKILLTILFLWVLTEAFSQILPVHYGFRSVNSFVPSGTQIVGAYLPLETRDFFIDNNTSSIDGWIDGNLTQDVNLFGSFFDNEIHIDLRSERNVTLKDIEIYDHFGGISGFAPTRFYAVNRNTGAEVLIGSYTGSLNNDTWYVMANGNIPCDEIIVRPSAVNSSVLGDGEFYGTEIRIKADYYDNVRPSYVRAKQPFGKQFGVNTYWYNINQSEVPYSTDSIYLPKYNRFLEAGISAMRLYSDVSQVEPIPYNWAFDPTQSGWHTDLIAQRLKTDGVTCLFNLISPVLTQQWDWWINNRIYNNVPSTSTTSFALPTVWNSIISLTVTAGKTYNVGDFLMIEHDNQHAFIAQVQSYSSSTGAMTVKSYDTYGSGTFASWGVNYPGQKVNIPVLYAYKDSLLNPAYYGEHARLAFITAGRYGRNSSISSTLMQTPMPANGFQPANTLKTGLNTMTYIEVGNELDAVWGGKYNYMNGRRLAAYLSALYDGNHGTIDMGFGPGVGVGIKTADTTMKVVLSGLGVAKLATLKGIYDWSKQYRGLKANGKVDVPFDVINFHRYPSNGGQFGSTQALPIEMTNDLSVIQNFLDFSSKYFEGVEVWNTEWGIDYDPQSVLGSEPIGTYTRQQVVALWGIRDMLMYSEKGLDAAYWYRAFEDANPGSTQFETMALWHDEHNETGSTNPTYERFPIADFMAQAKKYKNYLPDGMVEDGPTVKVARFKKGDSTLYAVWSVESTNPTTATKNIPGGGIQTVNIVNFSENTGTYNLSLPNGTDIVVNQLQFGTTAFATTNVTTSGSYYPVNYSSKVVFIEVNNTILTEP